MRIVQITPYIAENDGVSNCIFNVAQMLDELQYENIICSRAIEGKLDKTIEKFSDLEELDIRKEDIILYHFSNGNELNSQMEKLQYKKILVFHNVTDPNFFRYINVNTFTSCLIGKFEAGMTVGRYLHCIALSDFSKKELVDYGWNPANISVIPIVTLPKKEHDADVNVIKQYNDSKINILFTGRISPNKKIEDIIKIFAYYKKNVNLNARLFLVGSIQFHNYYGALEEYVVESGIKEDIIFTGMVSNEELTAYYELADVFLCMSEHEGFCIPLMEAMVKKIPVIAYSAAAVPDTLGGSGILVTDKDEKEISQLINKVVCCPEYREEIIEKQLKRVRSFNLESYKGILKNMIEEVNMVKSWAYDIDPLWLPIKAKGKEKTPIRKPETGNLSEHNKIVIYGLGKYGKDLLSVLDSNTLEKIYAICDNGTDLKEYCGIPVYDHEECMERYRGALFLITAQRKKYDIIYRLAQSGIEKEQIALFDHSCQRIEKV